MPTPKLTSVPPSDLSASTLAPAAATPGAPVTLIASGPGAPPDPIPAELRAALALFAGPLARLSFPDVDAARLEEHADAVRAAAAELAAARAAVDAAQRCLEDRTARLAATARRGLAYARIYADAHPEQGELREAVAAAEAARPPAAPATPPAPRRGRPPKTPRPELPFAEPPRATTAAEAS